MKNVLKGKTTYKRKEKSEAADSYIFTVLLIPTGLPCIQFRQELKNFKRTLSHLFKILVCCFRT
jgi:hypothetical protein